MSSAQTALLLVALVSASFVTDGHRHDPLADGTGQRDLARFDTGHSQPDRSVHVEAPTLVEAPQCLACLLPHRQQVAVASRPTSGSLTPGSAGPRLDLELPASSGACRLPASRAPPLA